MFEALGIYGAQKCDPHTLNVQVKNLVRPLLAMFAVICYFDVPG